MVGQANGEILRTVDTSKSNKKAGWTLVAHKNILVILESQLRELKCAHVYENEVHTKTVQLHQVPVLKFCLPEYSTLCGSSYLLFSHRKHNAAAVVDLNHIGSKAKTKTISFDQISTIQSLVWMGRGEQTPGEGYVFATSTEPAENWYRINSQVYEVNLNTVAAGNSITPMPIPFMVTYGSKNVFFECSMGENAILCYDLCGKNTRDYSNRDGCALNVLHLKNFNNQ